MILTIDPIDGRQSRYRIKVSTIARDQYGAVTDRDTGNQQIGAADFFQSFCPTELIEHFDGNVIQRDDSQLRQQHLGPDEQFLRPQQFAARLRFQQKLKSSPDELDPRDNRRAHFGVSALFKPLCNARMPRMQMCERVGVEQMQGCSFLLLGFRTSSPSIDFVPQTSERLIVGQSPDLFEQGCPAIGINQPGFQG